MSETFDPNAARERLNAWERNKELTEDEAQHLAVDARGAFDALDEARQTIKHRNALIGQYVARAAKFAEEADSLRQQLHAAREALKKARARFIYGDDNSDEAEAEIDAALAVSDAPAQEQEP